MKAVRVVIRGRVQGVFFRGWTHDEALRLGLAGWVRNRLDGSVEALFAGPAAAVDEMLHLCRQGPSMAVVDAVDAHPAEAPAEPGFHYHPTA
ncbi:MAG: acylphosphatase [Kiloniellales bacterium]